MNDLKTSNPTLYYRGPNIQLCDPCNTAPGEQREGRLGILPRGAEPRDRDVGDAVREEHGRYEHEEPLHLAERVERVGEEAAEENMLVAQIHPKVEKERSGVKRLAKPQLLHDLWQLSNRLGWWRAFWWA